MAAGKPDKIEIKTDAQYRVSLSTKVLVGRKWMFPRNDNVVRGDTLLAIYDVVTSFEPAENAAALPPADDAA